MPNHLKKGNQKTGFKMKIRLLLLVLAEVLCLVPAKAVLKEKDLNSSLAVLRHELTTYHREQQDREFNSTARTQRVTTTLRDIMQRSAQNSLMLYSQKNDYVFDLTYACHEATEQYQDFRRQIMPFKDFVNRSNSDIARYDSLIDMLSKMPTMVLSPQAKVDRNVCLTLAVNIRRMLQDNKDAMQENMRWYEFTEQRLKSLNDYANKRYAEIQTNIFQNGGTNYVRTLTQMNWKILQARSSIAEKYTPSNMVKSQWDVRWIVGLFLTLLVYGIVAFVVNFLGIRFLITWIMHRLETLKAEHKENDTRLSRLLRNFNLQSFLAKRTCIILASSTVTLAILLLIIRFTSEQNFLTMASNLLIEYAWLLAVILISLLLRVEGKQIMRTFRIYTPLITVGFIVISFRIVLIPNDLVDVVLPPILLLCTLWQWSAVRRHNKGIPNYDFYLTYTSLAVFVLSLACSWMGYTLMSVQLLIWWIMQMTCLLTLACVRDWLTNYRERKKLREKPVTKVWGFRLIYFVLLPSLVVYSFLISIYWSADVFNLSALTWDIFRTPYIDTKYIKVSLFTLAQVINLYFIFNYINHTSKALVKQYLMRKDPTTAESRSVMIINVLQVVVWGIWLLISLGLLHVSNTWLVVISGGLSTGIGFAMKDILENIYYGISLMAGRVKVGDWIECDGTKGKVSSISYTSTMLEAIDGSVIAFTNSQLFTKNYKNLTKNHGFVLAQLPFGVAYGSNIKQVAKLVEDAVLKLHHQWLDPEKRVKVVFRELGDSSINFTLLCWVDAVKQIYVVSDVMQTIYDTLNEHGIEIPFPQCDVHLVDQKQADA